MKTQAIGHTAKPRIVVLGAGFGGLTFCQRFPRGLADIILVDKTNHHLFQPLLYQVATAGLAVPDIAQPIRSILSRRKDVTVLMDEVLSVDLDERRVRLRLQNLRYDYLVMALGGENHFFGHDEWREHTIGLKSLTDAVTLRQKLLSAYEQAENANSPALTRKLLTSVVIGGGPTGVEMAGAVAELGRFILRRDFKRIDAAMTKVILVEAAPRILGMYPESLSRKAVRQLEQLGVEVLANHPVEEIDEGRVHLADRVIEAETVVWAAGIRAHPLGKTLNVPTDRSGRICVQPDFSLPGYSQVFSIGDMAYLKDAKGAVVPGVSPAAMQAARYVVRNLAMEIRGRRQETDRKPFRYLDKGSMATIGRYRAVAKVGPVLLSGSIAWLAWLVVHLVFLVGFRNKLSVFVSWMYSYLSYKHGARVIYGMNGDALHCSMGSLAKVSPSHGKQKGKTGSTA